MSFADWLGEPAAPSTALPRGPAPRDRSLAVTAVLGPTNTGKTHYALDRMLAHPSGVIGLPLRLLAREVYSRLVEKVGPEAVALVTGEEKIKPRHPRYWVCTVEAMPRDLDVSFVAIDEVQIAATLDRGHVFTDRLLNRRGRDETLLIGAMTMRPAIEKLLPGVSVVSRPRLSKLSFAGEKKLSRLPRRTAIVAFSAEEVYAIAELIRRQRGGAAVVLGALSPRTRNAQVELYQNGDVDYLVATDAIGMGLNLDVDHVAFAGDRKFDGWHYRRLNPAEFGQIAGRAGRHVRDGTFGTTGRCPPFDEDEVEALEDHRFAGIGLLQWRNSDLEFGSIGDLQASLDILPQEEGLTRAPLAEDVMVLDIAARDPGVVRQAKTRADIARLWEVCQVPDYRKVSPAAHAELALTLFEFVVRAGRIPDDWYAGHLNGFDRTDGEIDTLSARIAQVRTLTYIANRPDWLRDPEHWQGVARQVEDRLSDALHVKLAQRFVDRRTSVLMRRLRENAMLEAEVTPQGDVLVEGQNVGTLHGFRFTPDPTAAGEAARALNAAASKALAGEIEARAERFGNAVDESIALANDGTIRWLGDPVAKLAAGDKVLSPSARLLADEHLTGPTLEAVQRRLDLWLGQHVRKLLGPVLDLEAGEGLEGIARGIAFQTAEALGVLERSRVAEEVRTLDQAARGVLRKLGLRFGAYHLYLPLTLKPAPRALAAQLWAIRQGGTPLKGLDEVPYLAASGRTSFKADPEVPKGLYRAAGFRVCGERAVRVDILERLADLIRPAIAYRPGSTAGAPPAGAADGNGFVVTVGMTSLAGCSGEDFASILRSLGYAVDRRPGPAITVPLLPAAATEPIRPPAQDVGSAEAAPEAVETASETPEGPVEAFAAPPQDALAHPEQTSDEVPPAQGTVLSGAFQREDLSDELASEPSPTAGDATAAAPDAVDGTLEERAETWAASGDSVAEPAAAPDSVPQDEPAAPVPADSMVRLSEPPDAVGTAPEEEMETSATVGVSVTGTAAEPDSVPQGEPAAPVPAGSMVRLSEPPGVHVPADASSAEAEGGESSELPAELHTAASGDIASAADAADGPSSEPAPAPSEPVLIEVWRPGRVPGERRPERGGRPHRQHGRGGAPERDTRRSGPAEGAPADARDGDVAAAGATGGQRQDRRDRGRPPGEGRDRPRFGAPRPHDRPRQGGEARPEGGGRGDRPPREREGRGDRTRPGRDRPEEGRGRPFASTEPRPARERQPDPDSPFAKLLALKAELEGRTKE